MSYPLVYKHFCLTNYGSFFALYRKVKCTAFWNTEACAVHNISCCTFCQTEYICQVLCVKRKHNKHSQNRHENLQDGRLVKSTCNSSRGEEKRSLGLDGGRVTFCTVTSSPLLPSPSLHGPPLCALFFLPWAGLPKDPFSLCVCQGEGDKLLSLLCSFPHKLGQRDLKRQYTVFALVSVLTLSQRLEVGMVRGVTWLHIKVRHPVMSEHSFQVVKWRKYF